MKKFYLPIILSIFVFLAVIVFYANKNATDKVVIGMLSNSMSDYRLLKPFKKGLELAVREWNTNGGIKGKRISLIMADEIEFYSWLQRLWDAIRGNVSEYYPQNAAYQLIRKHSISAFFYYDTDHNTNSTFAFQERGIPVISPTIIASENDYFLIQIQINLPGYHGCPFCL